MGIIRENSFVCLDDITDTMDGFNPVIYNPIKVTSIVDRKRMLFNYIKEALHIELSDDELESLCHYECPSTYNSSDKTTSNGMLHDFIIKLRHIVNSK